MPFDAVILSTTKMQPRLPSGGLFSTGRTNLLLRMIGLTGMRNNSFVPLPKSSRPERILSNSQVYDFELDGEDMAALDALDRGGAGAVTWNPVNAA